MFFMFLAQFSHAWNCHAIKATEERNGKCEKGGRHMLTLETIGDLNLLVPGLSAT